MTKRRCLDCGTLVEASRCVDCTRKRDRARQAARGDRYGGQHQRERAAWERAMRFGGVSCTRCGQPIERDQVWDLDHRPGGNYPAHAACNRAAGGRAEA
jgi:hypothetical protein